jgi:hypothetical protein
MINTLIRMNYVTIFLLLSTPTLKNTYEILKHGMVMFVQVVHDLYRHSHLLPHLETLRGGCCCWKYALEPTRFDPLVGSDGFDPLWCKSPNRPQML